MKKVIALALALVMVCTMAMAVTVYEDGSPAVTTPAGTYDSVKPGTILYFTIDELDGDTNAYYNPKTGEFVPANNKVVVSYGKGAELVASQGWVRVIAKATGDAATVKAAEKSAWQYQIKLKDSDTATADGKVVDFSITKVTFKATSEEMLTYTFDGDTAKPNHFDKYEIDYGYPTAEEALFGDATTELTTGLDEVVPACGVITTMEAGVDTEGKAVKANNWVVYGGPEDNDYVTWTVNAGQKILRKDVYGAIDLGKLATDNAWDGTYEMFVVNDANLSAVATITDWSTKYNAYAVDAKNNVTKLAVVVDDGVATVKVPAYSVGIIYEGTLKNVKAAAAVEEVTNPGTGANDVVGVAAALAVVALVSGAAISLKK